MNEALILEKLDNLSGEIQSLKSEIQAMKESTPEPTLSAQPAQSAPGSPTSGFEDKYNELVNDLEPIAKQAYPHVHRFFKDVEDEFSVDELAALFRNLMTNIESLNEGMNVLRMGVELKDEIVPVAQIGYPKVLKFLNTLHEGEFQSEQLGTLLHTLLMNIHTFSDLMNMLKPMTELMKELTVVLRETDVISNTNVWLDSLQQSSGIFKLAGTAFAGLKQVNISDKQAEEISQAIQGIDFANIKPVTPFGAIKYLRDPEVQESLGAMFMVLQTMGTCLQAYQNDQSSSVS